MKRNLSAAVQAVEQLIQRDIGNRGIKHFAHEANGNLKRTCEHIYHKAKHVAVCTGFTVPPPENDGPLGTMWIAHGCLQLGKQVTLVSDEMNHEMMTGLLGKYLQQNDQYRSSISLIKFPNRTEQSDQQALVFAKGVIDRLQIPIDHVVSIERVGPSSDGNCYNMRGMDVSELNGRVEAMFYAAAERSIFTSGIGDGGNELGMGNVVNSVEQFIPNGAKIACQVKCDSLIISGVSNWAGYAICAILQQLRQSESNDVEASWLCVDVDRDWLHFLTHELKIVDGVKKVPSMSVDGLDYEEVHAQMINQILELCNSSNIEVI